MQFSINTTCLLPGTSFAEALRIVKGHGFDLVEGWTIPREQVQPMADALRETGVHLSAFCPARFTLNDLDAHDAYEESLLEALADAKLLHCPALITQVGNATDAPRSRQHDAIVKGLRRMAPHLEAAGVTLLVEPLNDVKDHKGYYLTDSHEGFEIIREVDSPKVRLLYDVYHQLHMGEDVMARIEANLPLIGHFHLAGFPNRDAALFAGYDYAPLLKMLKASGIDAPIGIELMPAKQAEAEALLDALQMFM